MKQAIAGVLLILALALPEASSATRKIYSPIVEYRELEFELRAGYDSDRQRARDGAQKYKVAAGYAPFERMAFEAYGEFEKEPSASTQFEAFELEARYQLFEQGHYWLDAGLYAAYAARPRGGSDKIEAKLLLEKSVGSFRNIVNGIVERELDSNADAEWGVAWSTRYRAGRRFEPGVEMYSDFGSLSNLPSYNDQAHYIGPVAYGRLGHWKYDVGYLFGISDAARDGRLKLIFEYEVPL